MTCPDCTGEVIFGTCILCGLDFDVIEEAADFYDSYFESILKPQE